MTLNQYIETINKRYKSGIARELAYRGDFENLFRALINGVEITNEPANVTDCGNPDYVLTKGKIPIGYIEAKDIGKDLNNKSYQEQFSRYKKALDNLIITDYIWFQFFQNGTLIHEIRIAEIESGGIKPLPENFANFQNLLSDFATFIGQTIKSSKKLAEMMAAKARLLQNILERAVTSDEETQENTSIQDQFSTFKQILIHDLTPKAFADIYAQTLAYGMFAARLHDPTLEDFSRQEAAELIPKSNPFLRKLFGYVAGPDIDERIKTTVDNLADVFRATNVEQLLKNFGSSTQQHDPIIHFYETFLAEYDPKLRKSRGVWYTPEPVVKFIVRAVDDILKTEFGLPQGLADTTKTKIQLNSQTPDKRSKTGYKQIEKEVHKVQILDPATGTGTFLAEVVKHIYNTRFKAMQGAWSGYVEEHLIPRLNGFELLMASYAMAHLKLDMLLTETGYKSTKNQRFNVFLTNSLEEYHPDTGTLFSSFLSTEANEANHIKRDTPVMCVIGNPPYSGISSNSGKWISNLIEDYKYVDGVHFNERKHWLNDDYVKFIRYGQHFIEKNNEGILAFINPHGFLDNPTFRGMRWNLLKTYDKIYTIDLHGNSTKKETCPDGSPDFNVFDIQQGVSINLFVKSNKQKSKDKLAEVYHFDLYGRREYKYEILLNESINTIDFKSINYQSPNYFFIPKNYDLINDYKKGFLTSELLELQSMGITSARDSFVIDINKQDLVDRMADFSNLEFQEQFIREKYFGHKKEGKYLKGDTRGWKMQKARMAIEKNNHESEVREISYRPFDKRYIYYSPEMVDWDREDVMKHLYNDNYAICLVKLGRDSESHNYFVTNKITDKSISSSLDNANIFPLYLEEKKQLLLNQPIKRKPNLNIDIVNKFAVKIGLTFTDEKEDSENTFAPIDILDYLYAALHSPNYREKYKELLKIDFPRVPYPKDKETFWRLVKLGGKLRMIHLLEASEEDEYIIGYFGDGDNSITTKIEKKDWELFDEEKQLGRIWINKEQYFEGIPFIAWEVYIGGYQPAQKWLKDRKGRKLSFEDILHYQKIIGALTETDRLMKEIDKIEIE